MCCENRKYWNNREVCKVEYIINFLGVNQFTPANREFRITWIADHIHKGLMIGVGVGCRGSIAKLLGIFSKDRHLQKVALDQLEKVTISPFRLRGAQNKCESGKLINKKIITNLAYRTTKHRYLLSNPLLALHAHCRLSHVHGCCLLYCAWELTFFPMI
jgi:hypothetical protein